MTKNLDIVVSLVAVVSLALCFVVLALSRVGSAIEWGNLAPACN